MITRHLAGGGVTDSQIRCTRCQRLLAEKASRPWRITCSRCGHTNVGNEAGYTVQPAAPPAPAPKPKPRPQPPMPPVHKPRRKRRSSTAGQVLS